MKKVLFCASTESHIVNFHLPYLKAFRDMGYEVHVAVNKSVPIPWADKVIAIPFYKSILSPRNICALLKAYRLLKQENYEKMSTHTTLAGVIMRLAALLIRKRPKIYHIVHGYIFNLSSGLKKYMYLIPEKLSALVSDVVMVMNQEDYEIAQRYHLYKEKLHFINGIGIDPIRFKVISEEDKQRQREKMGFTKDDFLFVYAAEFSKRKNQRMLIEAFASCKPLNTHLLLAGSGKELESCKRLVNKLKVTDQIHFLGYVNDVPTLYSACDAVVSTSRVEGLPFNIIEALGCGLPVFASNIKGHRDLCQDCINCFLFDNKDELQNYINNCRELIRAGQSSNVRKKAESYTLNAVFDTIKDYYFDD